MRKLPKGLLVKMVRIRLENEVVLIQIMSMIITRISMMLMRLYVKMVRIRLENEVILIMMVVVVVVVMMTRL